MDNNNTFWDCVSNTYITLDPLNTYNMSVDHDAFLKGLKEARLYEQVKSNLPVKDVYNINQPDVVNVLKQCGLTNVQIYNVFLDVFNYTNFNTTVLAEKQRLRDITALTDQCSTLAELSALNLDSE